MAEKNPIIAALDVPTAEQALELARELAPVVGAFKIGSELFTSAGPDIVKKIRATGASVFLDLKFHDIPNTVAKAVAAGGTSPNPKQDHGFMYGHGFEDLDGHVWELIFMDPDAAPAA